MKKIARSKTSLLVVPVLVAGFFSLGAITAFGEGTNQATGPVLKPIPKSVFIIPTAPTEGRDPFFPNSTRAPGSVQPEKQAQHADSTPSLFVLNGVNLLPGSRTAIINGRTIAEGETANIPTANGDVSVHLLQFKDNSSIVIQFGSQTQELHMRRE